MGKASRNKRERKAHGGEVRLVSGGKKIVFKSEAEFKRELDQLTAKVMASEDLRNLMAQQKLSPEPKDIFDGKVQALMTKAVAGLVESRQ